MKNSLFALKWNTSSTVLKINKHTLKNLYIICCQFDNQMYIGLTVSDLIVKYILPCTDAKCNMIQCNVIDKFDSHALKSSNVYTWNKICSHDNE